MRFTLLILSLFLVACGGGGGSSDTALAPSLAPTTAPSTGIPVEINGAEFPITVTFEDDIDDVEPFAIQDGEWVVVWEDSNLPNVPFTKDGPDMISSSDEIFPIYQVDDSIIWDGYRLYENNGLYFGSRGEERFDLIPETEVITIVEEPVVVEEPPVVVEEPPVVVEEPVVVNPNPFTSADYSGEITITMAAQGTQPEFDLDWTITWTSETTAAVSAGSDPFSAYVEPETGDLVFQAYSLHFWRFHRDGTGVREYIHDRSKDRGFTFVATSNG